MIIAQETAFAGDLFIPNQKFIQLTGGVYNRAELKTLTAISDLFLLHDKVYFRNDLGTIKELYDTFTSDELNELIINDRIKFYNPYFSRQYEDSDRNLESIEQKLKKLNSLNSSFKEKLNIKRVLKQINDNSVRPKYEQNFDKLKTSLDELFYQNDLISDKFYHVGRITRFNQGIEKIREIAKIGVNSISLDNEIEHYLSICDRVNIRKNNKGTELNEIEISNKSLTDKFHKFKNSPSLVELLHASENPTRKFLNIINSSEAMDFKAWIQNIDEEEIDIRDSYTKTVKKLPSKDKWEDRLRFGGVSILTGILASIASNNPEVGMGGAIATEALDDKLDDNLIYNYVSKSNPDWWIRFLNE